MCPDHSSKRSEGKPQETSDGRRAEDDEADNHTLEKLATSDERRAEDDEADDETLLRDTLGDTLDDTLEELATDPTRPKPPQDS